METKQELQKELDALRTEQLTLVASRKNSVSPGCIDSVLADVAADIDAVVEKMRSL